MLIGGGFALFGISDSVYLYRVANDSYHLMRPSSPRTEAA